MSDFYMPEELFTKILTYLPPKSLVRFTCVCKSWQSIITNSDFITDHLNQTKLSNNINNTHLFLVKYRVHNTEQRYTLHIDNNRTFHQYCIIELPFRRSDSDKSLRVLGSCNGLICLYDDYVDSFRFHNANIVKKKRVILWNPSIRKSLTFPHPDYEFLEDLTFVNHALGFGFDSRTNDYKVVKVTYSKSEKDQSRSVSVQLYKLSTGSWEIITPTIDPSCSVYYGYAANAFINGAVHWLAYKSDKGIGSLILSFNMSDEVFHEIRLPVLPVSVAGKRDARFGESVTVCGKRLLLFDYFEQRNNKSCSIWVMKEYGVVESWTKLYSIDLNGLVSEGLEKMLGFRRNGELLLATRNRQLVSFNRRTHGIKYLGVCDSSSGWPRFCSFYVDAYVESLVLLGKEM